MSMLGFLRRGETIECLKEEGKEPEERDRLMILVMTGVRTGRHLFEEEGGDGVELTLFGGGFKDEICDLVESGRTE